jgi:hypothetical protein
VRRSGIPGIFEEAGEIAIPDLINRHLERIHPHSMYGLLIIAALFAAHLKVACWDSGADRLLDYQLATHNSAPQ